MTKKKRYKQYSPDFKREAKGHCLLKSAALVTAKCSSVRLGIGVLTTECVILAPSLNRSVTFSSSILTPAQLWIAVDFDCACRHHS